MSYIAPSVSTTTGSAVSPACDDYDAADTVLMVTPGAEPQGHTLMAADALLLPPAMVTVSTPLRPAAFSADHLHLCLCTREEPLCVSADIMTELAPVEEVPFSKDSPLRKPAQRPLYL